MRRCPSRSAHPVWTKARGQGGRPTATHHHGYRQRTPQPAHGHCRARSAMAVIPGCTRSRHPGRGPAAVELADYLGNHWKNGALRVQAVTLVGYTSYDVTLEKQDEQKANTISVPPSKVAFARKNLPGGSKISSAVHCSTYTSPSVST